MKKIITLVLAVVLTASAVIGGTIAYLTSTDSDVNVMTVGNVKIEQHEFERVPDGNGGYELTTSGRGEGYKLQPFTQDKPLYPVYGSVVDWTDTVVWFDQLGSNANGGQKILDGIVGAQDKFVLVENKGRSDAFVRTLIAFELGTLSVERWDEIIMTSYSDFWKANDIGEMEIEGNNYFVVEYVYQGSDVRHQNGVLAAGDYSYNSLAQIYMKSSATNDDVLALDGNGNEKYDIIVKSQACQTANLDSFDPSVMRGAANKTVAEIALDIAFGESEEVAGEALGGVWLDYITPDVDLWDGTADTSWYNDTDTEFTLSTAEQLAGLADLVDGGNTFAGKTIKLDQDLDLYAEDENGNRVFFEPIGDASNADFSGTFDGNNKTIFNLRQDCNAKHVALFGAVYEGTVKNLILDGALIENDGSGYAGAIAAYAGASNFENITLRNTTVVNYNHNTGGIVAWCSNNGTTTTFDGIKIEDTTTLGSWWGSYDTRVGGVVGAMNTDNNVVIKNSTIACKLDVYNDATSNYQWYNYRTAGMVVADVRDNITIDGRTQANPARVTCENVEVIFGDWANYHYCESKDYGTPSYADEGEYKFRRVEAGLGYGGIDTSECNHSGDETHNELMAFTFLFGARDGKGIYGINAFDGVTVTYNK